MTDKRNAILLTPNSSDFYILYLDDFSYIQSIVGIKTILVRRSYIKCMILLQTLFSSLFLNVSLYYSSKKIVHKIHDFTPDSLFFPLSLCFFQNPCFNLDYRTFRIISKIYFFFCSEIFTRFT